MERAFTKAGSRAIIESRTDLDLSGIERLVSLPADRRRLGPFALTRRLGKGSFAPVWLARETYGATTLRQVALKLFALPGRGTPFEKNRALEAIVAEAGALCRVEHPNVVRFYALPVDESVGVMGLAMEYVDGFSLEQRLEGSEPLPFEETVAVGQALASALSAVHRAGLVHRDVKPANVISASAVYKLIDFGVAAAGSAGSGVALPSLDLRDEAQVSTDVRLASFGSVLIATPRGGNSTVALDVRCGTMGYIDPHCVASGAPATPASDLYALGATMFQCLVGRVPAQTGASGLDVSNAILRGARRPPPLAKLVPNVPRHLASLVDDLLEPQPAARPPSAQSVVERFEQIQWLLRSKRPVSAVAMRTPTPSRRARPQPATEVFDGVAVRAVGNALLIVHTTDARVERARFLHAHIERLAERVQGDVACLMVIPATADPPDTETRLEHARRFPKHGSLRTFVTVAVGDEYWHKVVQGITHGMNQALGRGCLFVSAKTIPQGIEAMLDVHRGQATREQVAQVTTALHEVCREMNVAIPE